MAKDYYSILGVDKRATKDEIKKAFRALAHKYHPDKKGGDAEKFKEVNEAYTILSDDQKRAQYDTYGQTFNGAGGSGQGGFGGFQGGGFGDFGFDFGNFQGGFQGQDFDLGDIFGEFFGGGQKSRSKRGRDISIDVELSFEESIFGVERVFLLNKVSICSVCGGSGAKHGSEMIECKTCNGKGRIREVKRSIFGSVEVSKVCDICSGSGKVPKERCQTCEGSGVLKKEQEVKVKIPSGIDNGEMIRLSGAGEALKGGISGDLYIKTHVRKHRVFSKEGNDLVMNLDVKLSDALLGANMDIETLDGISKLNIPEGVNTGEILRIKGKGVPHQGKRGDILARVRVAIPKKLSKSAKETIQKLREEGI